MLSLSDRQQQFIAGLNAEIESLRSANRDMEIRLGQAHQTIEAMQAEIGKWRMRAYVAEEILRVK